MSNSTYATFSDRVHVGTGGESDVLAGESGDPLPGLNRESEHGVVAPAGLGALVTGVEQRIDLVAALGSFGRDRAHALDRRRVLGTLEGEVAEERMDRLEAVVAGGGAVVPVAFEVVEEYGDQRRVEICDIQLAGRLAGALPGEAHQQPGR